MKRPYYLYAPAAHNRAQRTEIKSVESACAIEGYRKTSPMLAAVLKSVVFLLAVMALFHIVAKVLA